MNQLEFSEVSFYSNEFTKWKNKLEGDDFCYHVITVQRAKMKETFLWVNSMFVSLFDFVSWN